MAPLAKYLIYFFYFHLWVLLLPLSDIFLGIFQAGLLNNDFFIIQGNQIPLYYSIFSFMALAFNIMLAFSGLWLRRSMLFLDNQSLNCHANFSGYFSIILRVLISILLPIYRNIEAFYHCLLHILLIFLIIAFIQEFPIRNQVLCRFYAAILFLTESVAINITIYRLFSFISEDELFYLVAILAILAYKLGNKVFDILYRKIMFQSLPNNNKIIYFLEEICYQLDNSFNNQNECFLYGTIRAHLKHCDEEQCIYLKKHILEKNVLHVKTQYLVNKLVTAKFTKLIMFNSKNHKNISIFIVKFMSYLSGANVNPVKCFFEIQKIINSSKMQDTSFFHAIILDTLRRKIKTKIQNLRENDISSDAQNHQKNEITPEDFFKITKTQNSFKKHLKELIIEKKLFWENYEKGYNSTEDLILMGTTLCRKLARFLRMIIPNKDLPIQSPIYLLRIKYLSIFHSILFNGINKAMKYEDEYEGNVLKTQTSQGLRILQTLSFLDPNIVTCLVSYLKLEGELKEEYKTEKLGQFFGYSPLEFRSIHTLAPLMPYSISKYHNSFVANFLRKSKKALKKTSQSIDSFALNKKEFIFPIRIFLGYNFDYKEDFVLMGALMKADDKDYLNWLCDENGNTIGVSETFYTFLKKNHSFLNKNDVTSLNVLSLCPEIQVLVEEFKRGKHEFLSYPNQVGWLTLPEKLRELLNYINAISKEEVEIKKNTEMNNTKSMRSLRTVRSQKTEGNTNHSAFKIPKILTTISSRDRVFEGCENAHDYKVRVYSMFLNSGVCKKFLMSFDLNIQKHRHGPNDNDYILVIQTKIRKMESENDTNSRKQDTFSKTEEVFFVRKNLDSNKMIESNEVSMEIKGVELPIENETNFKNIFGKTFDPSAELRPPASSEDRSGKNQPFDDKKDPVKMMNFTQNSEQQISERFVKPEDPPINKIDVSDSSKDREVLAEILHKDQRSSSVMGTKTSHLIFNAIENIQHTSPKPLKWIFGAMIVEVLMIMIFFVVLYILYNNYVGNSYAPIQNSMINYCRLATSLSYSTAMFTEVEYKTFNITNRTLSPLKMQIWKEIMNDNYATMKSVNFEERNMPGNINYQEVYKEVENLFIDYQTMTLLTEKYADCLDFITDLIYMTIDQFNVLLPASNQIILQRNYPYMLPSTSTILDAVENDFNQSNSGTTQTAMNVMVVFLICSIIVKIFETVQLLKFHKRISQITNIFRRVNIQDSFNETNFCQEVAMVLHQPFLRYSFVEKCLNKRVLALDEIQNVGSNSKSVQKSITDRKIKKKIRAKSAFYNVKPLPITKIVVLMAILSTWSVMYYFFNYYFWVLNNQNINNLIKINIFFINVYIYSTSIVGFNTMALRERVVRNLDYEAIDNEYQNHQVRMNYFYDELMIRLDLIGNITASSLPQYTLAAQSSMQSSDFDQLVDQNICDLLFRKQFLEADEVNFCESAFDGAFLKGILNLVEDFLLQIKNLEVYTQVFTDEQKNQQQIEDVQAYINSQTYEDFMYSYYYYHHTLLMYYNYINDYYQALMDQEMNKLYAFLIATSMVSAVMIFLLGLMLKKKLQEYYRFVSLMLSLIPQEKVTNDEQTKFLINNLLKQMKTGN